MSDTDDTDTLLLVPPNLFSVPSESDENLEPSVVEDLISHVERLETRVDSIERISLLGSISYNEDESPRSFESSNPTLQTVYPVGTSFRSGKESIGRDKGSFLSEVDRYLISINASTMDNKFDDVLMNRIEGNEKMFDPISAMDTNKHLALPDVEKILREMESTQNEVERKLRERENDYGLGELSLSQNEISSGRAGDRNRDIYHPDVGNRSNRGTNIKSDFVTNRRAFILGENLGSVPDLGFGVRELYQSKSSSPRKLDDPKTAVEEPMMAKRDAYLVGSSSNGEDATRSTGSSIFIRSPAKTSPQRVPLNLETRRSKVVSPRRKLPFSDHVQSRSTGPMMPPPPIRAESLLERNTQLGGSGDRHNDPPESYKSERAVHYQPKPLASHFRGNLMSLADLWRSENNQSTFEDPSKLKQKLEEEKVRRMHLEEAIQSLNKRVLEEQEKLAVAMVVDEGKDKAIHQITEAWKQMVEHWKKIEADRHTMSQKLISEKTSLKRAREDVDKKIERWEKEVSQALDLAAGYKNKCELLEAELAVSKEVLDGKITDLEEKLNAKEKTLNDLLEERKVLSGKLNLAQEELVEGKRMIDLTRKELDTVQGELSKSEAELTVVKEQKNLIDMRLKEEKGRISVLEQHKRTLEDQLEDSRESQVKAEEEAKTAIAELETSKSELRNLFQNQLEMVVRSKLTEFQGQLDAAQLAMQAEIDSTKQMAQKRAEDQHNSLMNSHLAEMRRLEAIHKEELKSLELKLHDSEKRRIKLENNHKEIAQKLHGVMENQWQQALGILTSELSMRQPNLDLNRVGKLDGRQERLTHQPKHAPSKPAGCDSETSEDTPFNKDDLVTCRSSADRHAVPSGKQEQLLKYIQMLLDKQPGKAVESSTSMLDSSLSVLDVDGYQHKFAQLQPDNMPPEPNDQGHPTGTNKKPPWR